MTPPPGARRGARPARPAAGQATVELALVLPLVVLLLLALVQTGLVVRDQVLTVHAAREAAREASVGADMRRVRAAATEVLDRARVEVGPRGRVGEPVEVRVRYRAETDVPLVGAVFPDVDLEARVVMRAER
jgi:Flp pilus assembly protein TadG